MSRWPFQGRAHQLDRLVGVLSTPASGGIVVVGEAGVGKTRLLAEARHRAGQLGIDVRAVRASVAGTPWLTFASLVPPDARATDLPALFQAVETRLAGSALVVDDAHALDPGSAALIEHLLLTTTAPVAITIRTGADRRAELPWLRDLDQLTLAPFDDADIAGVLAAALEAPVESSLGARLAILSQGNPLLLREIVDAALTSGALCLREGVWYADRPMIAAATLPAAIEARLDRLPDPVRVAAELLALAEPLDPAILERLLPVELVEALEAERLLGETAGGAGGTAREGTGSGGTAGGGTAGGTASGGAEIVLAHPLYGEALRATMPATRARRHRRLLAETVEALGRPDRRDLLRAAQWRMEGGLPADPVLLLEAARAASRAFDHDLAGRLAQAAISAGGGFPARAAWLNELPALGRAAEALVLADELLGEAPDEAARVRIARTRADTELILGRVDAARGTLADARARTADPRLRLELAANEAAQAFTTGHVTRCLELGAMVLERAGDDPSIMPRLAVTRIRALACAGRPAEAIALAEAALSTLDRAELPPAPPASPVQAGPPPAGRWWRATVRMALLQALALDGQVARAIRLGEDGVAEARVEAVAAVRGFWAHELGQVRLLAGDAAGSRRWLRETLALLPIDGLPANVQLWSLDAASEASAILGDLAEADRYAERLRAVLPAGFIKPRGSGAVWTVAAGGDIDGAAELAQVRAAELEDAGSMMMAAWVLHDACRLGAARVAGPWLTRLAGSIHSGLARLMAANGAALAAADPVALDEVSRTLADAGCRLWAAEAATRAGHLHRAAGQVGSALSSASTAAALRSPCGSVTTPLLSGPAPLDPLTRRERQVAQLAARGLSDQTIADELHLSLRTVHSHLYRTYRKLAVADRTALARLLDAPPQAPSPSPSPSPRS